MYTLRIEKEFHSYHYLTGGDWGPENSRHKHLYKACLKLEGERLDRHGFLVDIVKLEGALSESVKEFENKTLNSLRQFEGLNPSIENFARIIALSIASSLDGNIETVTVSVSEDNTASASYRMELG
ncbi:MAG: 6-carboxytetrahydropterin synthase [Candidatus Omnitrophica bacterium]|nr:6-carboxytetrahydropterin synthase [Candidatus Omnitrophota bacterium]